MRDAAARIAKKSLLLGAFFVCAAGARAAPGLAWELALDGPAYALTMRATYRPGVSLAQVRGDLRDLPLLAELSGPISGGRRDGGAQDYAQVLELTVFGLTSELWSSCHEGEGPGRWTRRCDLDVDKGAAARSMRRKFDEVACAQPEPAAPVVCDFRIEGAMKALTVLGVPLMSAERLALTGKYEALKNFAQLWFYRQAGGVGAAYARERFAREGLDRELDALLARGKEALDEPGPLRLRAHGLVQERGNLARNGLN